MSIREQKVEIENILSNIYITKADILKNVSELTNYIDTEVFDISYEEDKNISDLIQKRVNYISNLVIDALKSTLKDSDLIEFKTSKIDFEVYEPICYIYGFKKLNEEDEYRFKKLHVNSCIENENAFLIILDLVNGAKIVPWK